MSPPGRGPAHGFAAERRPLPPSGAPLDVAGAIDIHVHAHPSRFPRLTDDLDLAAAYAAAGLAGFVLKSHHASTANRAYLLGRLFAGLFVGGGIVLNHAVGGLNPAAVEARLRTGGRIVWMPTVDAATHLAGVLRGTPGDASAAGAAGLSIRDGAGNLLAEVHEVLALVRDADAILATGHLAAAEVAVLVPAAIAAGLRRVIVTHPLHTPPALALHTLAELVALGAFADLTDTSVSPMWRHAGLDQTRAVIARLGADRCLLVSDGGQRHNPLAGLDLAQGLEGSDVAHLARHVRRHPRRLGVDRVALLVGRALDELDPPRRHDLPGGPGVVEHAEAGGAHADQRRPPFPEIHLAAGRGEAGRAPPPHHQLGVGPRLPDPLDRGGEDAADDEVERRGAAGWGRDRRRAGGAAGEAAGVPAPSPAPPAS